MSEWVVKWVTKESFCYFIWCRINHMRWRKSLCRSNRVNISFPSCADSELNAGSVSNQCQIGMYANYVQPSPSQCSQLAIIRNRSFCRVYLIKGVFSIVTPLRHFCTELPICIGIEIFTLSIPYLIRFNHFPLLHFITTTERHIFTITKEEKEES